MTNREEKLQQLIDIREAILGVIKAVFDEIDSDLESFTFTKDNVKLVRASRARLALKSTRKATLDHIAKIGEEYE